MTDSPLVNAVLRRLRVAGYRDLPTPFRVATVDFDFTAAMRGSDRRALDLVLLVDTTTGQFGDRDGARVRHRVEALSRALDVTRSRYVITVVLVGATLGADIEALSETCRVLRVDAIALNATGEVLDDAARYQLDDRLRVLLPLELPSPAAGGDGVDASPLDQLKAALPASKDKTLISSLFNASLQSDQAVTDAIAGALADALAGQEGKA